MTSLEAVEVADLDLSEFDLETVEEPTAAPSPNAWDEARRAIDEAWASLDAWRSEYEDAHLVTETLNEQLKGEVAKLRADLEDAERRIADLESVKSKISKLVS